MQRFLSLALLLTLGVGSAPTADAQLGRLLNRAKEAVSGRAEQAQETAEQAAEEAVDRPPARADGAPAPGIDYSHLLDIRFFPARGTFGFGDAGMVFPPSPEGDRAEYLVRDASGSVVGRQRLRWQSAEDEPAFALLRPIGGVAGDGQDPVQAGGRYTLDVEVHGELVGSVPFTVTQSSSGDAFNPVTTILLDGPWRTHAYFSHETDRPDYILTFNAWISPEEAEQEQPLEVSIRRGGREVAWGEASSRSFRYGWAHDDFDLMTPESRDDDFADRKPNSTNWTIQDVTPGPYEVVLSTESGPLRSFTIEGASKAFVPHPRSALDYEPRAHFLTQRQVTTLREYRDNSLYWMAPME